MARVTWGFVNREIDLKTHCWYSMMANKGMERRVTNLKTKRRRLGVHASFGISIRRG
jgi:hypothetical protein